MSSLETAGGACLEGAHEAQHGLAATDKARAALQGLLDHRKQLRGRPQHIRLGSVLHGLPAFFFDQGLQSLPQALLLGIDVYSASKTLAISIDSECMCTLHALGVFPNPKGPKQEQWQSRWSKHTAGHPLTCCRLGALHCPTYGPDSGRDMPEMLCENSGNGAMEGCARGCIGGFPGSVSRPGRIIREQLRIVTVPEHPLVALAHPRCRAVVVRFMPSITALFILQAFH